MRCRICRVETEYTQLDDELRCPICQGKPLPSNQRSTGRCACGLVADREYLDFFGMCRDCYDLILTQEPEEHECITGYFPPV